MTANQKQHDSVVKIALLGAAGRMGQTILETARGYPGVRISAAVVRNGSSLPEPDVNGLAYSTDLGQALAISDVLVDFSTPQSTSTALDACIAACKPFIPGVTGLDAELKRKIETASRRIAVLAAPNMSLGATLLLQLARIAATALNDDFDIEITDVHHRHKKDAPSGTALALGEAVAAGRGVKLDEQAVFARHGQTGARRPGSIGFTSVRDGDIVGDHSVLFAGPAERLELTHRAHSRAAFARGALAAARWIIGKPADLYNMADILGIGTRQP
ncbi:MAG: 4-hydroxy-tetrahydrodipicolinate reductase [Gammaproteobacteria bacterium]